MAESKNNLLTHGLSGAIGKLIVFKQYGKRTIVSKMPDMSHVVKSDKQKKENKKFREANYYAKAQMNDPVSKAEYREKVKDMQRPHNLAVADFYNPPQIRNIEISNSKLVIYAWDDFKVVRVSVQIHDGMGKVLQEGDAVEIREWHWEFTADIIVPANVIITVRAWDKPGNMTEKIVDGSQV